MALENTKSLIRSCVVSTKKGLTIRQLERDFGDLVGSPIPFQEHGFQSLDLFLRSIPDTVRLTTVGKETLVEHVPDESVARIASLVSRQKGKPKKGYKTFSKPLRSKHFHSAPRTNQSRHPIGDWSGAAGGAVTRHTADRSGTQSGHSHSSAAARLRSAPVGSSPAEDRRHAMQNCSESEWEGGAVLSTAATSLNISTSDLSGGGSRPARAAPALCPRHRAPHVCQHLSCDALHVCRLYVDGFCPNGDAACRWGHTVTSDGNQAALSAHQLQTLPESELMWLVRALLRQTAPVDAEEYRSQLAVCAEYAADARCDRPDCFQLHLCPQLAAGGCGAGAGCRWSHRLTDPDNVMVLLRLRCAELSEAEVLARLAWGLDDGDSSSDSGVLQTNGIESDHDAGQQPSTSSGDERDPAGNSTGAAASSASSVRQALPKAAGNGSSENQRKLAMDVNLCWYNINPSRCAGDCGHLHLCRLFLADMCPFTKKCKSGHKLRSQHNAGVLKERGLEQLSGEELLDAIKAGYLARNPTTDLERRFALQVCRPYQEGKDCGEDCLRMHVCNGYVAGTCANGSGCGLSHQLSSTGNIAIVKRVGLGPLRHSELMELLRTPPAAKDVWQSLVSSGDSVASSSDSSPPVERSNGCSASCQAAPKVSGTGPLKNVRDLALDVNLCHHNIHPSLCEGNCGQLHLCRNFVADMCPFAKKCRSGHNLRSPHNAGVLKECGLGRLSEEALLDAIKAGYLTRNPTTDLERRFALQTCNAYLDDEDGCEDEECSRLHVCDGYVAGTCANGSGCGRCHQLLTGTNAANINRVGLKHLSHKELMEVLRTRPTAKDVLRDLAAIDVSVASSSDSTSAQRPSRVVRAATSATHDTDDCPTLCAVHASGGRCQRADCSGFHICGFFLASLCRRPDDSCPLGHSFDDAHNQRVLEQCGLRGASAEHFQELIDQMTQRAHITFPNDAEKEVRMCVPYNSRSGCSVRCGRFHVCHRYLGGTCSGNECSLRHALDGSHNQYVRDTLGLVAAFGPDGKAVRVTDRELTELLRARLGVSPGVYSELPEWAGPTGDSGTAPLPSVCGNLISGRRCPDAGCGAVHVCPHFLAGACRRQHCTLGHRLDTGPNQRALRLAGRAVTGQNHDTLIKELYEASVNVRRSDVYEKLRICISHNRQEGCGAQGCTKIHICQKFVAGSCTDDDCDLGHVVGTQRNRKKLRLLGLENAEVDEVLEMLRAVHGVRSAYVE